MRRVLVVVLASLAAAVVVRRARSARRGRLQPAERGVERPAAATPRPWVEASDGDCPISHPVKVKVTSGIYHLPGSRFYGRTRPERCYVDAAAAEADGYRAAKSGNGSAARSSA